MTGSFRYALRFASWTVFALALLLVSPVVRGQDQNEPEPDPVTEIETQFGVVEDPAVVARVDAIKTRLLAVIPESKTDKREIRIKVLDDDTVNAFALPDGHLFIFRGLLEECQTDDMLAGVVAHELVHIFHRHHAGMGDREIRGMLIGMAAMIASRQGEGMILGQMISASMVETYGRSAENDADRTGLSWAVDAGYDPVGFLELMQLLEQESIHRPRPGGNYFTVHPNPEERMASIRDTLKELGIDIPDNVYRVHIPLRFYLPLAENESINLAEWETRLAKPAPSAAPETDEGEESEEEEIPPSLLSEYRLRTGLFDGVTVPSDGAYGVVAAGDTGVFYIAAESEGTLTDRAEEIISRLGDLFLDGLRSYEVQASSIDGEPVMLARRRAIASTTEADAGLFGRGPMEANTSRVQTLKDILYRYFVNRRI